MKPNPTDCPDCKEYIEQIARLKTILTENNDTYKKHENEYQGEIEELHEESDEISKMFDDKNEEAKCLWRLIELIRKNNKQVAEFNDDEDDNDD